ncbi:MAG: hypothetical protein ACTTJ3_08120 [Treponema sp.]
MIRDDFNYFKANRDSIISGHLNEYVVIKNCKVLGYFPTEDSAIDEMKRTKNELGSFILQKCVSAKDDKVVFYTRRVAF